MGSELIKIAAQNDAHSRTALPAQLFSARGKLAVILLDMSDTGATARATDQPPSDSYALLVRNGIKLPATVEWVADGSFGLRFDVPLADARLSEAFRARHGVKVIPSKSVSLAQNIAEPERIMV